MESGAIMYAGGRIMTGLLRFVWTLELYPTGYGEPSEDFKQGWTGLI